MTFLTYLASTAGFVDDQEVGVVSRLEGTLDAVGKFTCDRSEGVRSVCVRVVCVCGMCVWCVSV